MSDPVDLGHERVDDGRREDVVERERHATDDAGVLAMRCP